jgi:hypothetical protein
MWGSSEETCQPQGRRSSQQEGGGNPPASSQRPAAAGPESTETRGFPNLPAVSSG